MQNSFLPVVGRALSYFKYRFSYLKTNQWYVPTLKQLLLTLPIYINLCFGKELPPELVKCAIIYTAFVCKIFSCTCSRLLFCLKYTEDDVPCNDVPCDYVVLVVSFFLHFNALFVKLSLHFIFLFILTECFK